MRALMIVVLGFTCAVALAVDLEATHQFNIPQQPLAAALVAFGRQTNIQVMTASMDLEGLQAPAVHGTMSAKAALLRLLQSTDLRFEEAGAHSIAISKATHSTADERGAAPLMEQRRDAAPAEAQTLEEIIVTAQKRQERLIDTPQSISIMSAGDLAKLGATQFRDFANTVPGLTFATTGAGTTQVSLRGVTTGYDSSPTVGIYVDDVPYGSSTNFALGSHLALDVGLFDVDRIEVLRGPQGTLYGASTMGGLIKYVSKRPNTHELSADVQAGVSATKDGGVNFYGSFVTNVPLVSDVAAIRISGFESHDGGFIDNVAVGSKDINRSDTYGGRVDFLATPTQALELRLTGFVQQISRDGQATVDYSATGASLYGSLAQNRLVPEPFEQRFELVSGTVSYDFGPTTLTSLSSFQSAVSHETYDASALYVPFFATLPGLPSYGGVGLPYDLATHKFTQEVRLASKSASALEWLIGGFYTHESSQNIVAFSLYDLALQSLPNDLFLQSDPSTYQEYAGFGDLTWHLTSAFDVTGGIRYSHNHQEFSQDGTGAFALKHAPSGSGDSVGTYLVNARYHFTPQANAYLRYATGYRPGGPNFAVPNGTAPATFRPDRLKSYEAGFKADTAEHRVSVDVAAYYIDWSDIQVAVSSGGFGAIANATGGATVHGAELTVGVRPVPAFNASGAFAYQHAYMNQDSPELGASRGERLPNVPRFTAALNADYSWAVGALPTTVGSTVRYISNRMASFDASTGYLQYALPAYTSVDLRAGLQFASCDLQVFVHNLLDERGELSANNFLGRYQPAIFQPRTIGVALNAHF